MCVQFSETNLREVKPLSGLWEGFIHAEPD